MNLLRIRAVSFTTASHRNFRRFATAAGKLDCVTYNTLITDDLSRAVELLDQMRRGVKKGLSPNVDSLCKHDDDDDDDRIDDAYKVLNEMFLSGFSPSVFTLNHVLRGFLRIGDYNTLITEMCKAEHLTHAVELLHHMKALLTPNKITYTSLIHSLCKHDDRIHDAYRAFNEMIVSGFSPSIHTANHVLRGFLRIGDTVKAYEMYNKMKKHVKHWWIDQDTKSLLQQGFSDGVTYTTLMNAYLDEGKLFNVDQLHHQILVSEFGLRQPISSVNLDDKPSDFGFLPNSVMSSVFINGLDNKARTPKTNKYLLRSNYGLLLHRPTFEYRRTLVVNCSDDEFKSLVELVKGFCNRGLENAYDTMLKWNYKPDGRIVYNLFIIEHCKCYNAVQAYNMYKEMVHYGFACHIFTVFALIKILCEEDMVNELRWVIQNVLKCCYFNDSEILKFLNEFNPKKPDSEALFNVLAEKVKDGLFLKCTYAPATATRDLEVVEEMSRRKGDCVTFNTLICQMYKAEELNRAAELLDQMRPVKGLSTNETTYTSLIDSLCKHDDRIDEAYRVLIEMIASGFSPSAVTLNNVLRGFLRIGEMGNYCVTTCNTLITEMCKAEELSHAVELLDYMWRVKGLSPNETTYTSLIHSLCKHDRIDDAYRVLNEMFVSGFSPSNDTMNHVLRGFLRIGETKKAYEMDIDMREHSYQHSYRWSMDFDTYSLLLQGLSNEVTYTSLMNAYFDEGKLNYASQLFEEMIGLDELLENNEMPHVVCPLSISVMYSVFINGVGKKGRTAKTNKYLLDFHRIYSWEIPTLAYGRTLVENCSFDEFQRLLNHVNRLCNMGLENAYDTMLKFNYKPDGIVYNLFIIEYCNRKNTDKACNIYKEMVHYGFACHMFTVIALIRTISRVNQQHWVIQNILRSCNLNDSEILKFLNEFNPKEPISEVLFNVLAEKVKDGPFLKCSCDTPSA